MRYSPIVLLILVCASCFCQSSKSKDSVDVYIKRLNWESFVITSNYVSELVLKSDALKLVELQNRKIIKKLVSKIDDPDKAVVIHVILTKIIEPEKQNFAHSYNYSPDSTIQSVIYNYNGLLWVRNKEDVSSVSSENIKTIKNYWRSKIDRK